MHKALNKNIHRKAGGNYIKVSKNRFLHNICIFLIAWGGICFSAATAGEAAAGIPVAVKAEIDKNSVSIGEKIKYTLEAKSDKDVEIKFPDFGENLAGFAIRDYGSSKGGFFGSRTLTQWYVLDIYETGKFTIPAAAIKYRASDKEQWREALTGPISVEVRSVLDRDVEKADIRDIKGPVGLYNLTYIYIVLAIIAVIILIVLAVTLLKKRRKPQETMTPPRPAHEIAYEALRELMSRDYIKAGRVREYYFELSNIVRHYIEDRFHLKAPEMTTEEFLTTLKYSEVLNRDQKGVIKEFLSHCDMVKFAKYLPDEKEVASSYGSAKKLIDGTKETAVQGANS
jgi:uncharacterized membrane protein